MTLVLRFRLLILALVAGTQIFSPIWFVSGAESVGGSVFRLVLMLSSGMLMFTTGFQLVSFWPRRALVAGGLLTAWILVSLTWSPDIASGARQISYMITILMMIYVFDVLIRNVDDFLLFSRMIVIIGGIVIILSYYELKTGNHFFRSSIQDLAESDFSMSYIAKDQAWFTFGNPNDLVVHIAFCGFVSLLLFERSKVVNFSLLVYLGAALYLANVLEARIVVAATIAVLTLFFAGSFQRLASTNALMAGAVITAGAVALVAGLVLADRAEFMDLSTFIRLQLIISAIQMASETLFVGVGSGGFESEMWYGGFVGRTYGIINPHNGMGRMLGENGVIGLLLFVFLLLGSIIVLSQACRATKISALVAATTVGLPLLFSVGSDPLSSSTLQLAIAFLWIACRFAVNQGATRVKAFIPNTPMHNGNIVQQSPPL